jgi:uncharacterized protein (DUF1015 family)
VPRISPFIALRYDTDRVGPLGRVTAPPYDVISGREHRRLLDASPFNITRLDLGEGARPEGRGRYRRAAQLLDAWRRERVLVTTDGPVYAAYEMAFRLHGSAGRVRGVVAAVDLEDPGGSIVPHERTMPGPVEDRLRLLRAVRTNVSCIECVYEGPIRPVSRWLATVASTVPDAEVTDDDGVTHRVWFREAEDTIGSALADASLMIADGHHRYTTALRYRDEMRGTHGAGPWDAALMLLVDASIEDPPVLPFHRIQLNGTVSATGTRVRDLEEILESIDDRELTYGVATSEEGTLTHRIARVEGEPPVVAALHDQVLRVDPSMLRFSADAVAVEDAVRAGEAVAGYFLPATDARTIRRLVERGERLPEKSTFFWPKPRTGLLLRTLDMA